MSMCRTFLLVQGYFANLGGSCIEFPHPPPLVDLDHRCANQRERGGRPLGPNFDWSDKWRVPAAIGDRRHEALYLNARCAPSEFDPELCLLRVEQISVRPAIPSAGGAV